MAIDVAHISGATMSAIIYSLFSMADASRQQHLIGHLEEVSEITDSADQKTVVCAVISGVSMVPGDHCIGAISMRRRTAHELSFDEERLRETSQLLLVITECDAEEGTVAIRLTLFCKEKQVPVKVDNLVNSSNEYRTAAHTFMRNLPLSFHETPSVSGKEPTRSENFCDSESEELQREMEEARELWETVNNQRHELCAVQQHILDLSKK